MISGGEQERKIISVGEGGLAVRLQRSGEGQLGPGAWQLTI